jgi:VCBS repeat-containing protein
VAFNTTSTSTADRIIEVTVNDGTFDSNVGTTLMHVVANVPPALNLDADSSTIGGVDYLTAFTDGGPAVAIVDTDVLITDSDDTELTSATVTLTNPDTDDVLVFNGTPPLGITASLYDPGTGILTLTGTASLAAYQTALHQITFDNVGPTPSTDTRIIDVVVNDGTVASNLAQAIIHVAQVNNIAPVVDLDANDSTVVGTSFSATFTEGGAPIPIADIDTLITDTDSTTLASATITLTDPQAGDLLAFSASSYDPVTGILTLSGVASFADYETALEAIRFSAAGDNPVAGNRIIQVVVNDGTNDSQPATSLVTVVAVNDPPINTVPGGQTVAEDTTLSIAGVSVADSDSSALTTTLSVANGILNVTAGPGVTGDGTASVTIAGTAAEINAALLGLAYTGNLDFNGADTLTVATSDATSTATDTIAITVNPVNDAPINSVPAAQTVAEDTILPIAGVSVADIDSSALTTTLSVAHGTLTAGPGVTGNGTASVTIAGTAAEINAALVGLAYTGNSTSTASTRSRSRPMTGPPPPPTRSRSLSIQ